MSQSSDEQSLELALKRLVLWPTDSKWITVEKTKKNTRHIEDGGCLRVRMREKKLNYFI